MADEPAAHDALAHVAGDVKIVDTSTEAERILSQGVSKFSRALVDTLSAHVESTTAEFVALGRVNDIAAAEYARLGDDARAVKRFYDSYSEQGWWEWRALSRMRCSGTRRPFYQVHLPTSA
jgi:hypothetical protein